MKQYVSILLLFTSFTFAEVPVTDGLIINLKADALTELSDNEPVSFWADSAISDSV